MRMGRPHQTGTTHPLPFDRLAPHDFERMCLWLVEREGYERAEHLGAAGEEQGRDIVAWRESARWVFQCKRVKRFGPKNATTEVEKVVSLPDDERPAGLIFLVTCTVSSNTRSQAQAQCTARQMQCHFWAGTELDEKVRSHPEIVSHFFQLQSMANGSLADASYGLLKRLRVFVASPSDVPEERTRLKEVIEELDRTIAEDRGLTLRLVRWETEAWPGVGWDGQDVINHRIGPYDIFVGIMWKRFGTPTHRADSGTAEEFEQAYNLWSEYGRPRLMLYFNQAPFFPSSEAEIEQVAKVLAFRKKVAEKGVLYWKYNGVGDFEKTVRLHLIKEILGWETESRMVDELSALSLDLASLSVRVDKGTIWNRVCEIVTRRLPNTNLYVYTCENKNRSVARLREANSAMAASHLKPTWRIEESPFRVGEDVNLEAYVFQEIRDRRARLQGFLILERPSPAAGPRNSFSQTDYLIMAKLAPAIGELLSR